MQPSEEPQATSSSSSLLLPARQRIGCALANKATWCHWNQSVTRPLEDVTEKGWLPTRAAGVLAPGSDGRANLSQARMVRSSDTEKRCLPVLLHYIHVMYV